MCLFTHYLSSGLLHSVALSWRENIRKTLSDEHVAPGAHAADISGGKQMSPEQK